MARSFEYRHIVGFEETNVVGNVYFVNHFRWQGRCRELFLRQHAPSVLAEIAGGLKLMTVRASCDYFAEGEAFHEVSVRMRLIELAQNRMVLGFDYVRIAPGAEQPLARGLQEIACIRQTANGPTAVPVPDALRAALEPYRQTGWDSERG